mmetsp:Transcript_8290/g.19500  ORF Transcript_8290/g.19500 Transcript_8290/m.19500 type:complete len:210 (+) Transcript_8290:1389-2018(+)
MSCSNWCCVNAMRSLCFLISNSFSAVSLANSAWNFSRSCSSCFARSARTTFISSSSLTLSFSSIAHLSSSCVNFNSYKPLSCSAASLWDCSMEPITRWLSASLAAAACCKAVQRLVSSSISSLSSALASATRALSSSSNLPLSVSYFAFRSPFSFLNRRNSLSRRRISKRFASITSAPGTHASGSGKGWNVLDSSTAAPGCEALLVSSA